MHIFFVIIAPVILASFYSLHIPMLIGFVATAVIVLVVGYFNYRKSLPKKTKSVQA